MSDELTVPIARAMLARFVAELFADPDEAWAARLSDETVHRELEAAARTLSLSESTLRAVLDSPASVNALAERHSALLGHTVRAECPPYELEYARSDVFQHAHSLADVSAFYRAFGMETGGPMSERADHIVAEWEFLTVCALKQSRAQETAMVEAAEQCLDAQRAFLKDHAAIWMPAFFGRLRRAEPEGFLSRAADLAEALLREWCAALGVPLGPDWLELRPAEEEDLSINCGPGPGPGQVQLGPALSEALEGGQPE